MAYPLLLDEPHERSVLARQFDPTRGTVVGVSREVHLRRRVGKYLVMRGGDIKTIVTAALMVVVLFSVTQTKGFPALKKGHVYRVTIETDKSDEEIEGLMKDLKSAYGENWVSWSRINPTHVQWTFAADQDQPAPTGIPQEWAEKTTVEDLGPRVLI
jgi:hypothetical protein